MHRDIHPSATAEPNTCAPDRFGHQQVGWSGLVVNTGVADRTVRAVVAVTLLFVAWSTPVLGGDLLVRVLLTCFAGLNLFAVATGWCAMYCATGTSTVRPGTMRGGRRDPT